MTNDEKLLERARNAWEENGHFPDLGKSITGLFDRFEQMIADKEPTSIVWEPKDGEEYFYIDMEGRVTSDLWSGRNYDQALLKRHNIYKTRELAVKAGSYLQRYKMVLQAVQNLEPDQKVDWNDRSQIKYEVWFHHGDGLWKSCQNRAVEYGYPPLTDQKNVQPLLDYLNRKEKENG